VKTTLLKILISLNLIIIPSAIAQQEQTTHEDSAKPMRKNQIITIIQQHLSEIQNFGVKSLAIFGSVARNEATSESDVDLLVEFEGKVTFDRYMDLKFYLEDRLAMKVDLVTQKMLKPQIRLTVEKEALRVT
jgi:predicted nucleotidyltransferase